MPTEAASQAVSILRDGSQFQWTIIPSLAFVLYIYANEIERKNWNVVFAGLALWGMDWLNEIVNALIFHFTQYAPVWGAPADTAFLILIGLNIEICFMFSIAGVVTSKILPASPSTRILGLPNRLFVAITASLFCVGVEMFLNAVNALTWDWWWWNRDMPVLIVLFGYLTFFVVAFRVHDMPTIRQKLRAVGVIYAIDITLLIVFGAVLRWI